MESPIGFRAVKRNVLACLLAGRYQHEARSSITEKNKLQTGEVSAQFVHSLVRQSTGLDHSCSPHHRHPSIIIHVIRTQGWYIKFYFVDPDTMFISVHP